LIRWDVHWRMRGLEARIYFAQLVFLLWQAIPQFEELSPRIPAWLLWIFLHRPRCSNSTFSISKNGGSRFRFVLSSVLVAQARVFDRELRRKPGTYFVQGYSHLFPSLLIASNFSFRANVSCEYRVVPCYLAIWVLGPDGRTESRRIENSHW